MSPIQVNVRRTPRGVTFRSTEPQRKSHGPTPSYEDNIHYYYSPRAAINARNGEETDATCVIPNTSFQCESLERSQQQQAGGY